MKEKKLSLTDLELENTPTANLVKNEEKIKRERPKKIDIVLQKIKAFFSNKKVLVIILVLVVTGIATASIYTSIFTYTPDDASNLVNYNSDYLKLGSGTDERYKFKALSAPSVPKDKMNPINGALLSKDEFEEIKANRPVAVMVNNHAAARPQSNLSKADIVYEALVESGITRYMPVYWQNPVAKVGPIRSARQYYLEWLSEYNAIYIHDGYASSTDLRVDAGGNIWRYGINSISTQGAWRDNTRVAPHNEYSSVANAINIGKKNEWTGLPSDFESWEFKNDAAKEERGTVTEVKVSIHTRLTNGGLYDSSWKYDKEANNYARYIAGVKDIDIETGKQITAKTVVLQNVVLINTYDDKAHIIIETMGDGTGVILSDGIAHEVTWEKSSRTERTMYSNKDGSEFIFNRGLIWVTTIASNEGKFDIIE